MKKIKILIPVYNDWESLIKLLDEINKVIEDIKSVEFDCMITVNVTRTVLHMLRLDCRIRPYQ